MRMLIFSFFKTSLPRAVSKLADEARQDPFSLGNGQAARGNRGAGDTIFCGHWRSSQGPERRARSRCVRCPPWHFFPAQHRKMSWLGVKADFRAILLYQGAQAGTQTKIAFVLDPAAGHADAVKEFGRPPEGSSPGTGDNPSPPPLWATREGRAGKVARLRELLHSPVVDDRT